MAATLPPTATMASPVSRTACWMSWICAPISLVASSVRRDSSLTSAATTAKPRPDSPARAASMVALRASSEVWPAMARMRRITSSMRVAAAPRLRMVSSARASSAAVRSSGRARRLDVTAGVDGQPLHVARRGGDAGDVLGGLRGGVGGFGDLLGHLPVRLRQVLGGAADALAGAGEGGDDLVDALAEAAGEEQPAGVMQPRLGLAPPLIDGDGVGLDQRVADGLGGGAEVLQGAVADALGQAGVAVAAGDLADRGDDAGEAAFGEGADGERAHGGEAERERAAARRRSARRRRAAPRRTRARRSTAPVAADGSGSGRALATLGRKFRVPIRQKMVSKCFLAGAKSRMN